MTDLRVIQGEQIPENWVNEEEMARILGIGRTSLWRLRKSGALSEHATCTMGLRARRYRPSAVIAELARYERLRVIEGEAA